MRSRRENPGESGAEAALTSSQEMREMAEAISLYRSAMRHLAEKQAARPLVPAAHRTSGLRMRLVLVPALGAALAAAVITPTVAHFRHSGTAAVRTAPLPLTATPAASNAVAKVDDAQLMDQIDSDLTEGVPDALQPLTGWDDSSTTATKNTRTEK